MFLGVKWILMQFGLVSFGGGVCREHTVITCQATFSTSPTVVIKMNFYNEYFGHRHTRTWVGR